MAPTRWRPFESSTTGASGVLAAAVIYGVLALILFGQGLLPGRVLTGSDQLWTVAPWASSAPPLSTPLGANPELFDSVNQFEPFLDRTRASLPDMPLWNPYIMAGRPLLANAQSAVFSPFNVPSYVLPRRVAPALTAALKVFVAALGTFLLARALGVGFAGALLAGLVFGFGQYTVEWVKWPESSVRVLLPWLLLLTDRVIRRPSAWSFAGLAALVACQFFGGHPETSYYVLGLTVLFALLRLAELRARRAELVRPALLFVGSLAAGAALAAIAIAPFVELLINSSDIHSRRQQEAGHVPAKYLLGVFMPDYWGRPTHGTSGFPLRGLTLERAFYAGALPLMLAGCALTRPSVRRVALALLGLGSLAVVVGFEPFFSVAEALPGPVRTDRLVLVFLFAVALLAGCGLDDIVAGRMSRRALVLAVCGGLLCLPLLYVAVFARPSLHDLSAALKLAWAFRSPEVGAGGVDSDVLELGALAGWLGVAAAGVLIVWIALRRSIKATVLVVAVVGLTAFDLFRISMGFNPAVTTSQAYQPATGAVRYLQGVRPARFAQVTPGLPANVGMRYQLYDARGYDYPIIDRFTTFWDRNIVGLLPNPHFHVPEPDDRGLRNLGLLSVEYLMQDPRSTPLQLRGVALVYDGPDARVYRNRLAVPRAFLVARQQVATNGGEALEVLDSEGFAPRSTVVTETEVEGIGRATASTATRPGSAELLSYLPERVRVETRAAGRSLLVLADAYYPGWKADVDGEDAEVHRVNYLFRGVSVPPGQHVVTFKYEPASFRVGMAISIAAAVLLLAACGLTIARRRPRGQAN